MTLFDPAVVWEYRWVLLRGLLVTTMLTGIVITLAGALAIPVALARMSRRRWLRFPADFFVEVVRATPLILQLIYIYYVLPSVGIRLEPFSAAIIGLTLNYTAYMSEVYRSGIAAVARGQSEAAMSLGPAALAHFSEDHPATSLPDRSSGARKLPDRSVQGYRLGLGRNSPGTDVQRADHRG